VRIVNLYTPNWGARIRGISRESRESRDVGILFMGVESWRELHNGDNVWLTCRSENTRTRGRRALCVS